MAPAAQTPAGEEIRHLSPGSVEDVLAATRADPFRRVVTPASLPGLNVFALARALRRAGGPPLVLVGELRRDQRFWAERNGGTLVERLEQALGEEVPEP